MEAGKGEKLNWSDAVKSEFNDLMARQLSLVYLNGPLIYSGLWMISDFIIISFTKVDPDSLSKWCKEKTSDFTAVNLLKSFLLPILAPYSAIHARVMALPRFSETPKAFIPTFYSTMLLGFEPVFRQQVISYISSVFGGPAVQIRVLPNTVSILMSFTGIWLNLKADYCVRNRNSCIKQGTCIVAEKGVHISGGEAGEDLDSRIPQSNVNTSTAALVCNDKYFVADRAIDTCGNNINDAKVNPAHLMNGTENILQEPLGYSLLSISTWMLGVYSQLSDIQSPIIVTSLTKPWNWYSYISEPIKLSIGAITAVSPYIDWALSFYAFPATSPALKKINSYLLGLPDGNAKFLLERMANLGPGLSKFLGILFYIYW